MKMSISKRDISILLFLFGLLGAFCVFQFYFRGAMDKKKSIEEENKKLDERIAKYDNIDANSCLREMELNKNTIKEKAAVYKPAYKIEDLILYMNEWEKIEGAEMFNFPEYEITEWTPFTVSDDDNTTVTVSGVIDWDQTKKEAVEESYTFGKANLKAEFATSNYSAFKELINSIYLDSQPKTIKNVTAVMDASNGIINGEIDMNFYCVQYKDGEKYVAPVITNVPTSVANIFGPTNTPTPTPSPTPREGKRK